VPVRYFIEIAYKGTHFSGWQVQPNAITVQEVLETEMSKILKERIFTLGCGRTDAGVHASQFFLHFDYDKEIPEYFVFRINKMLPKAIAVKRIFPVDAKAHARFDATLRSYIYVIDLEKNPFYTSFALSVNKDEIDIQKIITASEILMKYTDFTTFAKTGGHNKTNLCTMTESRWEIESHRWKYHVSANRFLRGMVRRIVGALLCVGKGKISLEDFEECVKEKKLFTMNISVPPQGLFLRKVVYSYIENENQTEYLIQ
jgi:tRNA pseudouridine38-40 synthase